MAGHSKHGFSGMFADYDQRNFGGADIHEEQKHHLKNSEGYMPKDRNRAMNEMIDKDNQDKVAQRAKTDPTYPAMMHGHEASKGAKVDAEILAEEIELLAKKERSKSKKEESLHGKE